MGRALAGALRGRHGSTARLLALAVVAIAVSVRAGEDEPLPAGDPLEPVNRKVLVFNYVADRAVQGPAARAYEVLVPRFLRNRVRRFIDNLDEPRTALNQLLQGRPRAAASDAARFVLNTTLGIGGLFDPAAAVGLQRHREDFGQTLGRWGVPSGPYLVVPIIGSSTLRDGAAKLVDAVTSPTTLVDSVAVRLGIGVADRIDARSRRTDPGDMGDDPYAYLRAAHLRERQSDVFDDHWEGCRDQKRHRRHQRVNSFRSSSTGSSSPTASVAIPDVEEDPSQVPDDNASDLILGRGISAGVVAW